MTLITQEIHNGPLANIDSAARLVDGRVYQGNYIHIGASNPDEPWDGGVTQKGAWSVDVTGLPSGLATELTLQSIDIEAQAINLKIPTLGQKNMAGSMPVVLASDQSSIPVTQSGTWNINNISGTISLPTGAATQATLNTLNGKFGTLGQKNMAGSAPVVLASNQSAIPVTQSGAWSISLPTGAATEATLSALNAKVTAVNTSAIAGTVTANQGGTWNINNIAGTISLPTGAATETTLAALNTKVTAVDTDDVTITSMPDVEVKEGNVTYTHSIVSSFGSPVTVAAANANRKIIAITCQPSSGNEPVYVNLNGGTPDTATDFVLSPRETLILQGTSLTKSAITMTSQFGLVFVRVMEGQ
jgi:hypothetical protein